ncbi:MAG: hypothetical protein E7299_07270 [Lachnospiraceae bacterium]|nr:hypothetical protein [Lachnospiraceae bacterium]
MKRNQETKWNFIRYAIYVVIALYGISSAFLYYKQTQWTGGAVYESDLPAHIKMIIVDGWYYSLTAFVYKALYMFGNGPMAIAVFLAICTVAAVYLTYFLMLKLCDTYKILKIDIEETLAKSKWESLLLCLAFLINFVMPCYIRGFSNGRYIGMESANIWHNSTYIVMKPLALLCIILYIDLMDSYQDTLSVKSWFAFSFTLVICTGVKPSFLVAFAPMMAIFLLLDLIKGIPFQKVVFFGLTVIPSLLVILLQNAVLFGDNTGNGWEIRPGYALSMHSGYPLIAAALSILFPLVVLVWNVRRLKIDRWVSFAWLMAFVGFAEVFLLCETGGRASDGNFMWGYSFAILIIFVVSVLLWLAEIQAVKACAFLEQEKKAKENYLRMAYLTVASLVLLYHIYCGAYFYLNLLRGVSYYMWD